MAESPTPAPSTNQAACRARVWRLTLLNILLTLLGLGVLVWMIWQELNAGQLVVMGLIASALGIAWLRLGLAVAELADQ